jgi:hypothetical protein
MAVRVAGVEVIDRDPIEPGAEILLHLPHHVAGEATDIGEPITILGRDNEAELVAILAAALGQGSPIRPVVISSIELTSSAISGRAIALQVIEMRNGGPAAGLQADDTGFDYDPAHAPTGVSLSCRELQPIGRGLASTDPRASAFSGTRRTWRMQAPAARLR